MAAKVPKCQRISLEGSTGQLKDPQLHLQYASIPYTTNPVRFVELNVQVASHNVSPRANIIARLQAVDKTPLIRYQELHL